MSDSTPESIEMFTDWFAAVNFAIQTDRPELLGAATKMLRDTKELTISKEYGIALIIGLGAQMESRADAKRESNTLNFLYELSGELENIRVVATRLEEEVDEKLRRLKR